MLLQIQGGTQVSIPSASWRNNPWRGAAKGRVGGAAASAQYMLRFHSFYPAHREHEYQHLMDDQDRAYFKWVNVFNEYDLYTKSAEPPNVDLLRPFYEDLISEFFPDEIAF